MLKLIIPIVLCVGLVGCASDSVKESDSAQTTPRVSVPENSQTEVQPPSAPIILQTSGEQAVAAKPQSALTPRQIVEDYLALIQEGRGVKAVRTHWNIKRSAYRLYAAAFDRLSDEEQAEVVTEHERLLLSIYADPSVVTMMKDMEFTNLSESREGLYCTVHYEASLGRGTESNPQKILLEKMSGHWRIVDLGNPGESTYMSEKIHRQYMLSRVSPLTYAKLMNEGVPALHDLIKRSEEARQGPRGLFDSVISNEGR